RGQRGDELAHRLRRRAHDGRIERATRSSQLGSERLFRSADFSLGRSQISLPAAGDFTDPKSGRRTSKTTAPDLYRHREISLGANIRIYGEHSPGGEWEKNAHALTSRSSQERRARDFSRTRLRSSVRRARSRSSSSASCNAASTATDWSDWLRAAFCSAWMRSSTA